MSEPQHLADLQPPGTPAPQVSIYGPGFFFAWVVFAGALAKIALGTSLLYDDDSAMGVVWAPF